MQRKISFEKCWGKLYDFQALKESKVYFLGGGQISEGEAKFPRKYGPGAKFPVTPR